MEEEKKFVTFTKRASYGRAGEQVEIKGPMKHRIGKNGRRRLMLNNTERSEIIFQQSVETAVAMFLDVEAGYSLLEIAGELGISVRALKDLTKTEQFMDCWNEHFMELGHDPRLKATQGALADMLPKAVGELKRLISGTETPAATKLEAIKELFRLVGVETPKTGSDQRELAEFLKDHNLTINQINVNPPTRPERTDKAGRVDNILDIVAREVPEAPDELMAP
jgi:hypothetical protein